MLCNSKPTTYASTAFCEALVDAHWLGTGTSTCLVDLTCCTSAPPIWHCTACTGTRHHPRYKAEWIASRNLCFSAKQVFLSLPAPSFVAKKTSTENKDKPTKLLSQNGSGQAAVVKRLPGPLPSIAAQIISPQLEIDISSQERVSSWCPPRLIVARI